MVLKLIPVLFIWLLFAAHIMRGYGAVWAAVVFLATVTLLIRSRYIPLLWQLLLGLAAVEWIRTALYLAQLRIVQEQPYIRLLVIMSAVILITVSGIFWMRKKTIRSHYE